MLISIPTCCRCYVQIQGIGKPRPGISLRDMSTQDQIDKCEKDIKRYTDLGRAADAERFEDKLLELRRKLKKEEKEIKPHPS